MLVAVALVALAALAAWAWGARRHGYWRRRRVPYERPLPFLGTDARAYLSLKGVSQMASEVYWRHPGRRYVGLYRGAAPQLLVRDPALARDILVGEFGRFQSRGLHPCEARVEPLLRNLFFADGDLWRALRQHLAPAFTCARVRAMFPLLAELAGRLQERALAAAAARRELDVRDLMARYTTDFIGACGFGVRANCLDDDDSAFRKLGVKIYRMTFWRSVRIALKYTFPQLFKSLKFLGQEIEDDMLSLVKSIREERGDAPSGRNDFMDLMIDLARRGALSVPATQHAGAALVRVDDELVAAQCFIFFAAGFETSTTAASFTLHQLARNPEAQARAQREVDAVLAKHGGALCYEAVKEMTYLECALKEGLRMFPPGLLLRKCTRAYTLPGSDVTIGPGVKVLIPLEAMQNDAQHFERPGRFEPERFAPGGAAARCKHAYMPFGAGPRHCVGARLGTLQSLAGMAALLARFTLRPAARTPRKLVAHRSSSIVQNIDGPVPLLFYDRKEV